MTIINDVCKIFIYKVEITIGTLSYLILVLVATNMKMVSVILIFACIIAIGESVPHKWRYSNPSYHSYKPQKSRYNSFRHQNGQIGGNNQYHRNKDTQSRTSVRNSATSQPSKKT